MLSCAGLSVCRSVGLSVWSVFGVGGWLAGLGSIVFCFVLWGGLFDLIVVLFAGLASVVVSFYGVF
jgi:hypothetical protein